MRKTFFLLATIFLTLLATAEEGMYPLSEIHKLNLKKLGFKLSAKDLYNPNGKSLIDAIVDIGRCTGSFVSPDGLILTNHHCAFPAVQAASSVEHDYINQGFLAKTRSDEIRAEGNIVRLIESYRDVSKDVLAGLSDTTDPAARQRAIAKNIRKIIADAEKEFPNRRAEVSEMFIGKTYVLFLYVTLRDVRLVYVPPLGIGDFGGENDNWVWPRHTGDFSFMRAYVAPDGSPADYSPNNVPYKPKTFLKIDPKGVNENDFVFILGYPGRTFRHRTSHYLQFERDIRLKFIADWSRWQIELMQKNGTHDRAVAIKLADRIKSLANTEKNYRGKIQGLRRIPLIEEKTNEEQALQKLIDAKPDLAKKYGSMLRDIASVFDDMRAHAQRELTLDLFRNVSLLSVAQTVIDIARQRGLPDSARDQAYTDRNLARTKASLMATLQDYHDTTDQTVLTEIIHRCLALPGDRRIKSIDSLFNKERTTTKIPAIVRGLYKRSRLGDTTFVTSLLSKSIEEIRALDDPFVLLAFALAPDQSALRAVRSRRDGKLNKLYADLVDVKQISEKKNFIPDANSTLRLTFGHIRGYSPADATIQKPFTTVRGIIEKQTGEEPFDAPVELLAAAKDATDVPVAMLYNLDTTGGNSGSPVLNAKGEVIGVNFDRTFEATINDYAWNESYSRSIAVDIRYVLWVMQRVGRADHIVKELGVK